MPEPLVYPEGMNRSCLPAYSNFCPRKIPPVTIFLNLLTGYIYGSQYNNVVILSYTWQIGTAESDFWLKMHKNRLATCGGGLTTPSPETLAYGITGGKGGQVGWSDSSEKLCGGSYHWFLDPPLPWPDCILSNLPDHPLYPVRCRKHSVFLRFVSGLSHLSAMAGRIHFILGMAGQYAISVAINAILCLNVNNVIVM